MHNKQNVEKIYEDNLQKPNIYNKCLPFYETLKQQSLESFQEICENLSRIIQLRELRPGFPLWSSKLQQFISLYGYCFTKTDHIRLIHLYLSVLSISDLNYSNAKTSFDIIDELLKLVLFVFLLRNPRKKALPNIFIIVSLV